MHPRARVVLAVLLALAGLAVVARTPAPRRNAPGTPDMPLLGNEQARDSTHAEPWIARLPARPTNDPSALQAEPRQTCTIHGSVRNDRNEPIAGGTVWALDHECQTDSQGRYELEITEPLDYATIYAVAVGHAVSRQTVAIAGSRASVRVDHRLVPEFVIAGRVVSEDGWPIASAAVTTIQSKRNVVHTDATGAFVLRQLDPTQPVHDVYARKPGWVQARSRVEPARASTEDIELVMHRGTAVEGFVIAPDGHRLVGAVLYMGFSPSAFDRLDAMTDEHGRFLFECVGEGSQTLVVQHPGCAPAKRILDVPESGGRVPALTITLEESRAVTGVVSDESGAPVAGAEIHGQQDGEFLFSAQARSGPDGTFRLEGLPATGASISVYADGFLRNTQHLEPAEPDQLAVVLRRAGAVTGRVIDAETGEPIETFTIRFVAPSLDAGEQAAYGYGIAWATDGVLFHSISGEWAAVGTQLPPGDVLGIEVSAPGYAPRWHYHVVVPQHGVDGGLVSALERGGTVRGVLVDGDDRPVPGVELRCRPEGANFDSHPRVRQKIGVTRTASDGTFEFAGVPAGPTVIAVLAPDRPMFLEGPFEVSTGATIDRVVRIRHGASIEGLSLSADGMPFTEGTIRIYSSAEGEAKGFTATAECDSHGRFAFHGLVPARYQVSRVIEDGGTSSADITAMLDVNANEVRALRLEPRGSCSVRGTVSFADGALPEHVAVMATIDVNTGTGEFPAGIIGRGALAKDGEFVIEDLPDGAWHIRASFSRQDQMCIGNAHVILRPGDEASVVLNIRSVAGR